MAQLLLIGDDLTGTLDSAVAFACAGCCVIPTPDAQALEKELAGPAEVVAINANTRHLEPADAAHRVREFVGAARAAHVAMVCKKTDSVLRGNIGAELAAARKAAGASTLHFVPAFPAEARTTQGGVQYVDGVPVAKSAAGADPFEPVSTSNVAALIGQQSSDATVNVSRGLQASEAEGIAIYDAVSDADIDAIVAELLSSSAQPVQSSHPAQPPLTLAGCAGLTQALARSLKVAPAPELDTWHLGHLLVVCGSVHPTSLGQLAFAKAAGAPTWALTEAQKLDMSWLDTECGQCFAQEIKASWAQHELTLVDASAMSKSAQAPTEAQRTRVARNLGVLIARLSEGAKEVADAPTSLLVMGGDVLLAATEALGATSLNVRGLAADGVVVFELPRAGHKPLQIISKSGGFGSPDLFCRLAHSSNQAGRASRAPQIA